MLRTKTCGELTAINENEEVVLSGWVDTIRNLGSFAFVDLRDRYGITQLYFADGLFSNYDIRIEDCIQVKGTVRIRKEANTKIPTGEIEILVSEVRTFSKAKTTPFPIRNEITASEDTRLEYRYLDLRRPRMQNYIQTRSDINRSVRSFFYENNFIEIDTPTMIKSTPEGARDYLIPSRIYPGSFYALPQSPQIYKQLLMISGFDRYFQLAHCYRDEDQRADRQPEFMQIDVEMSFVEREDVLQIIESLLDRVFLDVKGVTLPKFERIAYKEAISKYGSDKPDLRYGLYINDVTDILESAFPAYNGKHVHAIVVPGQASVTRKEQDADNELAKKFRVFGVSHLKFINSAFEGPLSKKIDAAVLSSLAERLSLNDNDLVILCADGKSDKACVALGALRSFYANKLGLCDKDTYRPCFILDWPMFERKDDGSVECLSNPFTRPVDEDIPLLWTEPENVRTYAYDTVLNGVELSSGALRIYDADVQNKVFELIGLTDEQIHDRFGFLVEALKYGVPPEGGFGIGIERLAMEIAGTDNVRDVVAFPKNLKASEPMSQCPSPVSKEDLDVLGIEVKENIG